MLMQRQSFQAEILRQMKEKQMEAKRKREIRSNYRSASCPIICRSAQQDQTSTGNLHLHISALKDCATHATCL